LHKHIAYKEPLEHVFYPHPGAYSGTSLDRLGYIGSRGQVSSNTTWPPHE